MSQRECAGFNWPPPPIPAEEPVSISPEATSRAGPHIAACVFKPPLRFPSISRVPFVSLVAGVSQPASHTTRPRSALSGTSTSGLPPSFQSRVVGVGHEPQPLPDVRRADARSAQIRRPDGVALSFQVSLNKVEPPKAVFACNLLAKDD
jgi:hypothetical protein